MDDTLHPGTRVRITQGAIGTILLHDPYHFTPYIASEGDTGTVYSGKPGAMPEGWLLVRLEHKDDDGNDLYAPVHPSMVETVNA
jgi:hypothetical protein